MTRRRQEKMILDRFVRQRSTSPNPSPLKGGGENGFALRTNSLSALQGGEGWGEVGGRITCTGRQHAHPL
jgi:hypothetical protein